MKEQTKKNDLDSASLPVVRLTNRFAEKAKIGFSNARQLRLVIGTISRIDPFDEKAKMEGFLSMSDLHGFITAESSKPLKNRTKIIEELISDIMKHNYIEYPSKITHKGRTLKAYRVFFDQFTPVEKDGVKGYHYRLHEDMRPDLKGLFGDYVSYFLSKKIKSGATIRFSILITAHHNKVRKYKKVSTLKISIEELRRILDLEDKYPRFNNFKVRVLDQITVDINSAGYLEIDYELIKSGKKVTDIEFSIQDGRLTKKKSISLPAASETLDNNNAFYKDYVPTEADILQLSKAQLSAYHYLIERKCKKGIALRRIVLNPPSTEIEGWEDIYINMAWKKFEDNTKYKKPEMKAGAFVKWWTNGEFKDRLFSELMEKLVELKKSKSSEQLRNRDMAKIMTATQFINWWKTVRID